MARKAKRKLPKSIRQAIDAKAQEARVSEAIAPMRRENPILERPPEVHQPARKALPAPAHHTATPDGIPYSAHHGARGLLGDGHEPEHEYDGSDPPNAEDLLQKVGAQVLINHQLEADEATSFWITLKDDILEGIQIRITMNKGRVSARMLVSSHHTLSFVKQRLPRLRKRFQARGMHLDEIEVIVA